MPLLYHMQNSIIGLILVVIMLYYVLGKGGKRQAHDSLFIQMIFSALVLSLLKICMDLLSGRVFPGSHSMNTIVVSSLFFLLPLPGFFYFLYIDQLDKKWEKVPARLGFLASIPVSIHCIIVLINLSNGMLFSITANNTYARGKYTYLVLAINVLYLVGGHVQSLYHQVVQGKKTSFPILLFPYCIVIAAIIQAYIEGIEVVLITFSLTLLITFLHIQNTHASRDFLTSLYNRSVGEECLRYLFLHTGKQKVLGGMLMDIDCFKEVNDQYGHELGDRCLRSFAQLLRKSFSRSWLICRYGGDEFLLLREMSCAKEMDEELLKFKENLEDFNGLRELPFELRVSVGKGVSDEDACRDSATFLKILDERMYLSKKYYHKNLDKARY